MIVKELIEKLQQYPQENDVVVQHYNNEKKEYERQEPLNFNTMFEVLEIS